MAIRIRFHLDEKVDPVVAVALERYEIDVSTTASARLLGASDDNQIIFAKRETRVLVTHDNDFLRMASKNPDHPGIAYCHLWVRTTGEIICGLLLIFEVLLPDEISGRVEYL